MGGLSDDHYSIQSNAKHIFQNEDSLNWAWETGMIRQTWFE